MTGQPHAREMARSAVHLGIAVTATMTVLTAWALVGPHVPTAEAAGGRAGAAQVVGADPGTNLQLGPLAAGDGETVFSLKLPSGAACTGDSANDGFRVQSYFVPESIDPATLTFNIEGPIPNSVGANLRQPLYDVFSSPYVNKQTADATNPPGPGPVINIPAFDFLVLIDDQIPAADFPAGTYKLGIACTKGVPSDTQMDKFWGTQMVISRTATGISWTAPLEDLTVATTTTAPGGTTSTTTAGGTSTTTGSGGTTSTTVAGGSTTSTAAVGSTSTTVAGGSGGSTGGGGSSGSGNLARSGGNVVPLLTWTVLLLIFGRMAVLLGRRTRVEGDASG